MKIKHVLKKTSADINRVKTVTQKPAETFQVGGGGHVNLVIVVHTNTQRNSTLLLIIRTSSWNIFWKSIQCHSGRGEQTKSDHIENEKQN